MKKYLFILFILGGGVRATAQSVERVITQDTSYRFIIPPGTYYSISMMEDAFILVDTSGNHVYVSIHGVTKLPVDTSHIKYRVYGFWDNRTEGWKQYIYWDSTLLR